MCEEHKTIREAAKSGVSISGDDARTLEGVLSLLEYNNAILKRALEIATGRKRIFIVIGGKGSVWQKLFIAAKREIDKEWGIR